MVRETISGVPWRALTAVSRKYELFGGEPHLHEAAKLSRQILGDDYAKTLQRIALMVIQPDCMAARRAEACLQYLRDHSFEPIFGAPFTLTRRLSDEIWRYQVNQATRDSRTVSNAVCGKSESLMLFSIDQSSDPTIPASMRLTGLKGASDPALRDPSQMRSILAATNRIVSAAHCSDEPIDMLREIQIVFGNDAFRIFEDLRKAIDAGVADLSTQIRDIYTRTPAHDMSLTSAIERVRTLAAECSDEMRSRSVIDDLDRWQRGERYLDWDEFRDSLRGIGGDPDSWDALLIGSHYLNYDRPGVERDLTGSGLEEWLAGEGILLIGQD